MQQNFLTRKEIFKLLVANYGTTQIADQLNISEKLVRNHISNVIKNLARSQSSNLELIRIKNYL